MLGNISKPTKFVLSLEIFVEACVNFTIFLLSIPDLENRQHTILQFSLCTSFREINFELILICKFQNVPSALGI